MRMASPISLCVCMSTGNNLGDEGVEQIVQTMRDLERADSLGTFRYARSSNCDSGGVINLLVRLRLRLLSSSLLLVVDADEATTTWTIDSTKHGHISCDTHPSPRRKDSSLASKIVKQ